MIKDEEPGDDRFTRPLSLLTTSEQKDWLDGAAKRQMTSAGALVRAAIEAYRRAHPDL